MTKRTVTDLPATNFNLADGAGCFARQSLLHDLAREGDVLSAEVILETGAAADATNDLGRRALHEAAFFGHLEMVKLLLDHGATLDAQVLPLGHTALYMAVLQGHHDIARYLIGKGARLDVQDEIMGTGLLHLAAGAGDMKMTGILIAAHADVFCSDRRGMTARDAAFRRGHRTLAATLLKVMEHHHRYIA